MVRYHLHQETKFRGGEYDQRGVLQLRHVHALGHRSIGKEADHIEESELIGEATGPIEYPSGDDNYHKLAKFVLDVQKKYNLSDRDLVDSARVSHRTLSALRERRLLAPDWIWRLVAAAEALRQEALPNAEEQERWREKLRALRNRFGGRNQLAKQLGISAPHLGRILRAERLVTSKIIQKLMSLEVESAT